MTCIKNFKAHTETNNSIFKKLCQDKNDRSHVCKCMPSVMPLGGEVFVRCLGDEGGALINGINALIKRA